MYNNKWLLFIPLRSVVHPNGVCLSSGRDACPILGDPVPKPMSFHGGHISTNVLYCVRHHRLGPGHFSSPGRRAACDRPRSYGVPCSVGPANGPPSCRCNTDKYRYLLRLHYPIAVVFGTGTE